MMTARPSYEPRVTLPPGAVGWVREGEEKPIVEVEVEWEPVWTITTLPTPPQPR